MSPGHLLLLTGSPGSGKTTVAPLVADRAPLSTCLDLDWYFAKLRSGALEPWRGEAHEQNRVVLSAAAAAAAAFAEGGYFTVVDGILYPFMLDLFEEACAPLGIDIDYAILRAPLPIVLDRTVTRAADPAHQGELADADVVGALWHMFEELPAAEHHGVDAAATSPEELATELYRRCQDGRLRLRR